VGSRHFAAGAAGTHLAVVAAGGNFPAGGADDRSWTPSSLSLAGNERA